MRERGKGGKRREERERERKGEKVRERGKGGKRREERERERREGGKRKGNKHWDGVLSCRLNFCGTSV